LVLIQKYRADAFGINNYAIIFQNVCEASVNGGIKKAHLFRMPEEESFKFVPSTQ
jgi:hypothetical protein